MSKKHKTTLELILESVAKIKASEKRLEIYKKGLDSKKHSLSNYKLSKGKN